MIIKKDKRAYYIFYFAIFAVCATILFCYFYASPVTVFGTSMHPTFKEGSMVATKPFEGVSTLGYGDVIVFSHDGELFIKRVVGLPGDEIYIVDGCVFRNGERINESFEIITDSGLAATPFLVSDECVFVLGDNRNHSLDSRSFGEVSTSDIKRIVSGLFLGN